MVILYGGNGRKEYRTCRDGKRGKEEIQRKEKWPSSNELRRGEKDFSLADRLNTTLGAFTLVIIPVTIVIRGAQINQGVKQNRSG